MGFKVSSSFLRFLTMGALGVQQTMSQLEGLGFYPIELERYCASNKIWSTKVKRLRLPDLISVRTGLRVEVRTKSDLKIRMSDAPNNPDRVWDAGLRDEDLIAFIACHSKEEVIWPAQSAIFFQVSDLRDSISTSNLGSPKSASEGAERDRTWPGTVPKQNGEVLSVEEERIRTILASGRRQTYNIRGKTPYVQQGEEFVGQETIIAGTVSRIINVNDRLTSTWEPLELFGSRNDLDRYSATKVLPYLENVSDYEKINSLEDAIDNEEEDRVALEMGSSLARLGSNKGFDFVLQAIRNPSESFIPMEAVFILSEIGDNQSASELENIATSNQYAENELRQAAVWGLGKAGTKSYDKLIQFLGDGEDDVAMHAITAFDSETPNATIDQLVTLLANGNLRQKAAACEVLKLINTEYVINQLIQAVLQDSDDKSWAITALGQQSPDAVRIALQNNPLLDQIQPILHLSPQENWLKPDAKNQDLHFLLNQNIY